jgi:hypothetical protein
MATPTYTLIDSVTLTSSASSVTFSSISATGKGDLVLIVNAAASANAYMRLKLNNDTGTNYTDVEMIGVGSNTYSASHSRAYMPLNEQGNDTLSTTFTYVGLLNFLDYSATDKHKSLLYRGNNTQTGVVATAGRWASTAAITSINLFLNSTHSFLAGSTFYLYQIVSE